MATKSTAFDLSASPRAGASLGRRVEPARGAGAFSPIPARLARMASSQPRDGTRSGSVNGFHGETSMRMLRAALLVLLSAVLAGCGGGSDLLLPGAGEPASVTLLRANRSSPTVD